MHLIPSYVARLTRAVVSSAASAPLGPAMATEWPLLSRALLYSCADYYDTTTLARGVFEGLRRFVNTALFQITHAINLVVCRIRQ